MHLCYFHFSGCSCRVDKKRDRQERQILDSQERAFWDVHRPVPGCVNTTEVDFRKLSRSGLCFISDNSIMFRYLSSFHYEEE